MNDTLWNMFPFHPGLDCCPDGVTKLCTVIIITYCHLSINFLLHYIEHIFVVVNQDAGFCQVPLPGYAHPYAITNIPQLPLGGDSSLNKVSNYLLSNISDIPLCGVIFLLCKSDIEAFRLQLYYIRLPNCPKGNITWHKPNITAKQYHSPQGEYSCCHQGHCNKKLPPVGGSFIVSN